MALAFAQGAPASQPRGPGMGAILMPAAGYGAFAEPSKLGDHFRGQRRRMNLVALCLNLFAPWLIYSVLFAVTSFGTHYRQPGFCWLVALVLGGMVLTIGAAAARAVRRRRNGHDVEPSWLAYLAVATAVAWVLGLTLGDMNYYWNMQPFYDWENLNTYPDVNPAMTEGQSLMDAGRVYFAAGSRLDLKLSTGFKNQDVYCVAPVAMGSEPLDSYDFWAVGMNCCAGNAADFHCGEYANPHALGGLRLMMDDQRAFYRLAVQQAEAAYNIKANHPLFFHWTQDPNKEMNTYRENGFQYFVMGMFTYFAFNFFCVIIAAIAFAKRGS